MFNIELKLLILDYKWFEFLCLNSSDFGFSDINIFLILNVFNMDGGDGLRFWIWFFVYVVIFIVGCINIIF